METPTTEPTETPSAAPVSPAKKRERSLGNGIAIVALIVGAIFAVYKFYPGLVSTPQAPQQKMVVLDTRKLLAASTKQIMSSKDLTNEQVGVVSQKLAQNMQKLVASYRDQGYIVLNSSAVIAHPDGMDITVQFGEQLGVKVE